MSKQTKTIQKQFDDLIIDSNFSGEHILLEDIPEVIDTVQRYCVNLYTTDYEQNQDVITLFVSFSKDDCNKVVDLLIEDIGYHDKLEIEKMIQPKYKSIKAVKKYLKKKGK